MLSAGWILTACNSTFFALVETFQLQETTPDCILLHHFSQIAINTFSLWDGMFFASRVGMHEWRYAKQHSMRNECRIGRSSGLDASSNSLLNSRGWTHYGTCVNGIRGENVLSLMTMSQNRLFKVRTFYKAAAAAERK